MRLLRRLLNIPFSVLLLYFTLLLVLLSTVRVMDLWIAIPAGVVLIVAAVLIWFDFAKPSAESSESGRATSD